MSKVSETLDGNMLISFSTGFKYPVSKEEALVLANALKDALEVSRATENDKD